MSDETKRSNLLSYFGARPAQLDRAGEGISDDVPAPRAGTTWSRAWSVAAAHAVELLGAGVVDEAGFAAISRSLSSAREAGGGSDPVARAAIRRLDEQIESQIPSSVSGAATLGLAREEWLATAGRLVWRDAAIQIADGAVKASEAALVLAETHIVTIMPAYTGGRPALPTTLAHYLGGVISPLSGARERLQAAFGRLNHSPLGAGMLAGDVLAADREKLAERLGFSGPIPNTFDALSSVEDLVAVLDAVTGLVEPLGRFAREIGIWIRTDPTSFVLDEGWTSIPEPAHPSLVISEALSMI